MKTVPVTLGLTAASLVTLGCGGGSASGIPESCEIRVDGQCYMSTAEACDAAGCPADRCTILESYPGQVECQAEAPRPDDGTGDEPVASDDPPADEGDLAEGAECTGSGQCGDGLFCDGEEGCDVPWTCQPLRACTRDLVPYCGCDGETFQSSGNCAGRPYASRGACE